MTVAAGSGVYRYDGNDVATTFPFPEIFYADADLTVVHRSIAGAETVLVLDTDYTVTGAGGTSGSVEFPKSGSTFGTLATGEKLAVVRTSIFQRTSILKNSYQFQDWNLDNDKQETKLQELERDIGRCAKFEITNSETPPSLEAVIAATAAESASHADFDDLAYDDSGHTGFMENIRYIVFSLVAPTVDVETGTNIGGDFEIPISGTILQDDTNKHLLKATNSTAGVTGTMVVDVHVNGTTIMTVNKIDIETTEKTSTTAATQPDLTETSVTKGDIITIDVDAIHSVVAAKGLKVYMAIRES
jgi:hypothetical protein